MAEQLLGNERVIRKLVREGDPLVDRVISWAESVKKSLAGEGEKYTLAEKRRIDKALKLYLKAAEAAGNRDLVKRILALREEDEENKIKYSAKHIIDIDDNSELANLISANPSKNPHDIIKDYLMQNFHGQKFVLSDGRTAIMDGRDASKLSGYSSPKGIARIGNLHRLIETAKYHHSVYGVTHKKFVDFHYYEAAYRYKGVVDNVWLNIGTAKNDGSDHIYDITNKKEETLTSKGDSRPVGNAIQNVSSTNSIPDSTEKVNSETKFSLKNTQINALKKRGVDGDRLLDAIDLADDILDVNGEITEDAKAVLYHATSEENAKRINATGKMYGKEDNLFFSTKQDGEILGYGKAVVRAEIPIERLVLNDIFDEEVHLTMSVKPYQLTNIRFSYKAPAESAVYKRIAEWEKLKVYEKADAEKMLYTIMTDVMPMPMEESAVISLESRKDAEKLLWSELNKALTDKEMKAAAEKVTDFIITKKE